MCGICGVVHFDRRPVDRAALAAMNGALAHRGPDGEGYWFGDGVGLGHRRLAIVDLAGGAQPMGNEDGSVQVTFNGEIYNHLELRRDLLTRGHRFVTDCDTEAIVHLYEERGPDLVERLSGMFAFALWDTARERLLLVRDRLGIKPLYVYRWPGGLAFASELKALAAWPDVRREIDPQALHLYLQHEFVPAPRSMLAGVEKLRPAELLVVGRDGEPQRRTWWRCGYEPKQELGAEEAAEAFDEAFDRAVRRRLMADVPLGAFLSGGLDSSSVVEHMRRHVDGPLRTFSIGFEEAAWDETSYAREVARRLDAEHHEEVLSLDAREAIAVATGHLDEPLGDASALPTFLVSRLARREVKVCLSGDGGDELLAGYERHLANRLARLVYAPLPGWLRRRWIEPLAARLPVGEGKKGVGDLVRRFVAGAAKDPRGAQMRWQTFLPEPWLDRLLTPGMRRVAGEQDPWEAVVERAAAAPEARGLDRELAIELGLYLPDDVLTKVDRMSMAVGLEARVPFLDHELVELAARLPVGLKMRRGRGKWLLRRAMRGRLPERVVRRRKQGFGVPVKRWLRGELHDAAADAFAARSLADCAWLESAGLSAMLAAHRRGDGDHSHTLWPLFVFALWWDELSRGRTTAAAPPPAVEVG